MNRKDSLLLFTTLLDLYSSLVEGYERMILYRKDQIYTGCSLKQMFDCDGFISSLPKAKQSFMKEFLSTQLFSNLITSRIEVTISPSSTMIDFPILFFDKYISFMKLPFEYRYSHLEKVLFQKSNRILVESIPLTNHSFSIPINEYETEYNEMIEVIKKQNIDSSYQEQDIVYTVLVYCSTCKQAIDLRVVLFYFLIIK